MFRKTSFSSEVQIFQILGNVPIGNYQHVVVDFKCGKSFLMEFRSCLEMPKNEVCVHPYFSNSKVTKVQRFEHSASPVKELLLSINQKEVPEFQIQGKSLLNPIVSEKGVMEDIIQRRMYKKVVGISLSVPLVLMGHTTEVFVKEASEGNVVDKSTKIRVILNSTRVGNGECVGAKTGRFGGYPQLVERMHKIVEDCLESGVATSVIVHGFEGNGKSFLVDTICSHFDDCAHVSKFDFLFIREDFKEKISGICRSCCSSKKHIIVIDNIHFDPEVEEERGEEGGGDEGSFRRNRGVFLLKHSLDYLLSRGKNEGEWEEYKSPVVLIGIAMNGVSSLPEDVYRRFMHEVCIPLPNVSNRRLIMQAILDGTNGVKISEEVLSKVANYTANFVARDLFRLLRLVYFLSNKEMTWEEGFQQGLELIHPTQLHGMDSEVLTESAVEWNMVGGYGEVKRKLKQTLYWPLEKAENFEKVNLPLYSGVLLYGPSGCGKTYLTKAISSLRKMSFFSVKCSEIFSMYTGETEFAIRRMFESARKLAPCVLVFDEIDALAPTRSGSRSGGSITDSGVGKRALSQLLNEMDGIQSREQVFVIGCTNRKQDVDPALLRPGRLDQLLYVGYPSEQDRVEILERILSGVPCGEDVDVRRIAGETNGCSGAELVSLVKEAGLKALRENMDSKVISMKHFVEKK